MRCSYRFLVLIVACAVFLVLDHCAAETRYVSDVLHVNLFAGKGQGEKLRLLKSNEQLDVIEESEGFVRVRAEDGTEGWIAAKFVTDLQPKTQIIQELQRRLVDTEAKLSALMSSISESKNDASATPGSVSLQASVASRDGSELARQYDELQKKSRKAVELVDKYDTLQQSFDRLSHDSGALQAEIQRLQRQQNIIWFLSGGGVFGAGWVAGKLSRRRKQFNL